MSKPVTIHSYGAFHDITLCIREGDVIVSGGIDQEALWSAAVEETGGYDDAEAGMERNPALAEETYREGIRDILDDVVGALVEADIVAGDLVFRDHDSYCEEIVPLKDRRILRLRAHYYDGNFDFDVEKNIDAEEE